MHGVWIQLIFVSMESECIRENIVNEESVPLQFSLLSVAAPHSFMNKGLHAFRVHPWTGVIVLDRTWPSLFLVTTKAVHGWEGEESTIEIDPSSTYTRDANAWPIETIKGEYIHVYYVASYSIIQVTW